LLYTGTQGWNYRLVVLFSTFLLLNIDSSLLFNYRFPTLRLEL